MLDADNMTARCDVQTRHDAVPSVDAVREALHRIPLLVDIRKDIAADRAREDTVQGCDVVAVGLRLRTHDEGFQRLLCAGGGGKKR